MSRQSLIFFCGGPSSEHEVSLASTRSLLEIVDTQKYDVQVLFISKSNTAALVSIDEARGQADWSALTYSQPLLEFLQTLPKESCCVLAGIHGEFVEDGALQTILEYLRLPYTGSGPAASRLAMDKYRSSLLVASQSLALMPPSRLVHQFESSSLEGLTFPLICKPNSMGSSVGLHVVKTMDEAQIAFESIKKIDNSGEALFQEYLQGSLELTCSFVSGTPLVLPPIEIHPKVSEIFDYEAKYTAGGSLEVCPPTSISKLLANEVSQKAKEIHELLGCEGYSRSDFLLKDDNLYYLETNTLPGMTKTSLLPQELAAVGVSVSDFITMIVDDALARFST